MYNITFFSIFQVSRLWRCLQNGDIKYVFIKYEDNKRKTGTARTKKSPHQDVLTYFLLERLSVNPVNPQFLEEWKVHKVIIYNSSMLYQIDIKVITSGISTLLFFALPQVERQTTPASDAREQTREQQIPVKKSPLITPRTRSLYPNTAREKFNWII